MTSLKRSQTERPLATDRASVVGTDGTPKVHTDDFYMRRFRSQNGSLGSSVMAPVGPPRSEGSHHITSTPGVPKMGVRARIADWPPRKENIKESSRSSQEIETSSCLDSLSSKSSPVSQGSSVSLNSNDSAMLKSIQNTLKNKTRPSENMDSRFLMPEAYPSSPRKALRRIRQRSNSDITISELDVDSFDECISPTYKTGPSLHREYGSTSSIDKQGTSGDSFFDLLKGYKDDKSDRGPTPTKLSDFLISGGGKGSGFSLDVIDGPISQRENLRLFKEREKPLKRRSKSETGDSSIFRKLRNAKGEELGKSSDLEDNRSEDSVRPWTCPKCFAHYDVQSILFDLNEAIMNRHNVIKRRNTTTGASAAAVASLVSGPLSHSASFSSPMGSTEDLNSKGSLSMDQGDDKSNELVMSCPYFRNEIGGEGERKISLSKSNSGSFSGCESASFESTLSSHCTNAGVAVLEVPKENLVLHLDRVKRYIVEHVDLGAYYYRKFFYQKEHWNYFGADENLGPVAVSIRREKPDEMKENGSPYNYRIIFRTSELMTLRGSVLEDAIPSTAKHSTARGLPLKEVLEHVVPELNVQCLRLAFNTPKVTEQLMKLDEQGLNYQQKVGIMYCKAGQSTEEEMYNNESAGPAFEEFLQLLGERVRLKGFEKYRAQLDTKTDSTGTHSLYTTYKDYEIMFHVSTMLPYTPNNKQQLLRKRHIGNDIVTIVFQEPGAQPFSPKNIRSHFQHVFVIVRVHNPCSDSVCYRSCSETYRMPVMEYKMNEGVSYEFKFPFRNNNKWQRNASKGPHSPQVPSQVQSPMTSRLNAGKGDGKMPPPERAANIPRSISSDGRPLERRLSPGSDIYVTVSSMALARSQCRNSPSNLSSSSDTGSVGGTYRQKSMPEGFGVSRRSPASIDRQNTQSDIGGSGKSTPSWQRSEDSIADQMAYSYRGPQDFNSFVLEQHEYTEPTCHLPAVSKVLPAFRESPSGRLMRQDPVVHLSPNKQGHSDSHYSSHSSSNTLSSNASSAHSDEKWYDGDRTESELNSYNYLQGTSADSGIDTTSYGPSHGSTASLGAATSSPRSGPGKEKVAPLWHSSSEVISMADRTLETESHGLDRKTESSLSLDIHSKSQASSSPLTRENSTFSINDAASHTSTMSSRHSASPVVFTSARSSPKEELHPAAPSQLAPSFSSSSSSSSGPRSFYPRQGATSKYLIGWKKPEGTINSVGFMDTRKRHQSDGNEIAHTRLRASTRDLRASPKPTSKSTIEEDLKKLIDLESPTPESQKSFKFHALSSPQSPFPSTPTSRRALHRTLSDESIYSSQREHFFTSRASLLDQALPNDVLFSSTYPSLPKSLPLRRPSYTLGMKSLHGEFSASDSSLTDIQETRRQPMPDPGLMPLPDTAADLDWSNLVDAAKAYEVQRASFFAASDENHRPLSAASNSDQLEDQALAQMKPYSSSKDSSPTLASKVDQLEGMLKMLREDLKKEKEDKAHLQAEVQHLREDNLRLQEESQNASDKLKKFTEWVFNTIDMS
ncbi:signal-induced proliferation-associated 1-like protein 1 isoform X5 [Symphalangus syndactylus]|uniref:signal-induced proliferation-associated 1-like protein 1 isoform X5 n=1 Tax=Symphalangus syndactylus TaxID=9590 RepID=UPI0024431DB7|nr:signal-induced proliferation-associated 1-like protein 1 isoform X5 [Symphalangus syndactylus]